MQRVVFTVIVLAMTAAGVASAHVFVPVQYEQASYRRVAKAAVGAPSPSSPATPAVQRSAPAITVEGCRPPVPVVLKPRPAVAPVITQAAVTTTEAQALTTPETQALLEPIADEKGAAVAKAAIEADGYKGVRIQHQGVNGVWHARALRGRTEVLLTVDKSGAVRLD